jgi:3-oxoacyl-[acyl-carrier-protein] synthase II
MISPLGVGAKRGWTKLIAGESGIVSTSSLNDPEYDPIPSKVVGAVPKGSLSEGKWNPDDYFPRSEARRYALLTQYAIAATKEALTDAKWSPESQEDQEDTGVCIGSGIGAFGETYEQTMAYYEGGYRKVQPLFVPKSLPSMGSGVVSMKYGLKGPNHTVTTACATGNHAIGDAYRFIKDDYAQVMVAGATETGVVPLVLAGFARAKSLSTKHNESPETASRPFDQDRDGFVLSEGCGILILEELEHAKNRGAQIYAEIVGYGLSGDGYHMTAPDPKGSGALRAMKLALRGHDINKIDYVNAHATSTTIGDSIECGAMQMMLKGNDHFHVSSTKGSTGHLLGAAGAVEAIFTTMAIRDQICPPTLNLENPTLDPNGNPFQLNFVGPEPVKKEINYALSNSFGFGGINTSLVFKKYE